MILIINIDIIVNNNDTVLWMVTVGLLVHYMLGKEHRHLLIEFL